MPPFIYKADTFSSSNSSLFKTISVYFLTFAIINITTNVILSDVNTLAHIPFNPNIFGSTNKHIGKNIIDLNILIKFENLGISTAW